MAVLDFSLTPDATGRVYELLTCLAKFGDTVSIEARAEKASFMHEQMSISIAHPRIMFTADLSTAHTHSFEFFQNGIRLILFGRKQLFHQLRLQCPCFKPG